jgi:cytidine deaminase
MAPFSITASPDLNRQMTARWRGASHAAPLMPIIEADWGEDVLDLSLQPLRVEGGKPKESRRYLGKLLEAVAHARTSQRMFPNLSHRHYGALVEMDNGVHALGTNVEGSRQLSLCDLRVAITSAFNQSVAQQSLHRLSQTPPPAPQIKTIFLVNAESTGGSPIPCSDCQSWLNSRFCSPDTKVVSLEPDPQNQGNLVRIRTVGKMLPLHKGRNHPVRMATAQSMAQLKVNMSSRAKMVLGSAKPSISFQTLKTMMTQAQLAYQKDQPDAKDSGLKTGVCVRLSPNGSLHSQSRFDWSTRWFESADLRAVANGFDAVWGQQTAWSQLLKTNWLPPLLKQRVSSWLEAPTVQAIAYMGDDPGLPPLASLGYIARRRGSLDTLILTVEDDVIHCRTIADFMPEMYQTPSK